MSKHLHLLYVTGLGDSNVTNRQKAINTWKLWGVTSEIVQMNWRTGDWETKYQKLLKQIDNAVAKGCKVALVGESAGAGAAINAYAARKDVVTGVVLLAGKVNRPQAIGGSYRKSNSAFVDSAQAAVPSLKSLNNDDRKRILSRFAVADPIVTASDSRIPGAKNQVVPTAGHIFTIATQIIFGAPSFIRFLKKLA